MNYNKLILNLILVGSFFSMSAENRYPSIGYEWPERAKKAGRVAKVGAYGVLTGVTGAAAVALAGLDCCLGYLFYLQGQEFKVKLEREFEKNKAFVGGITTLAVTSPVSVCGLGALTLYFASKTKKASEELNNA